MTTTITTIDQDSEIENVAMTRKSQPLTGYNEQGEIIQLGHVISRTYQGEKVQRHSYKPLNGEREEYSLGPTTTAFQFVNHESVMRPFMEQGYEIQKLHYTKGGLQFWAQLTPPDAMERSDLINWDHNIFPNADGKGLRESVIITSAARPKKSVTLSRGWFRLICTNGLMSEVLGLGHTKMSHANWNPDHVLSFANGSHKAFQLFSQNDEKTQGALIGNKHGANRLLHVLNTTILGKDLIETITEDEIDEDGEYIPKESDFAKNLPLFIRQAATPLARVPKWWVGEFARQLEAFIDYSQRDEIYALDAVNMITSPVNSVGENPSGLHKVLGATSALTNAMVQLLGGMSLS